MKCQLIIQLPEPDDKGFGALDVDNNGGAVFIDSEYGYPVKMKHARLIAIIADGIRLCGFQGAGYDKKGRERYVYQEWYIIPKEKP